MLCISILQSSTVDASHTAKSVLLANACEYISRISATSRQEF